MMTNDVSEASERLKNAINIVPMERMGVFNKITDAAVWLCSGESSFVTKTGLIVDGVCH
jgi:NAD(P)-dependent dehydrogenase (short-subunit alcohol dehydrogenase family)